MSYDMFYKSIIEQDKCSIVICNLEHEIIYMNPAAIEHYAGRGGKNLIGKNLLDCHNAESKEKILRVAEWFAKSADNNIIYTYHNDKQNKYVYMIALRNEDRLIGYYEKQEYRNAETMKMYDF